MEKSTSEAFKDSIKSVLLETIESLSVQKSKWRIDDIVNELNCSRSTFWRLRKDHGFPKGQRISKRITIWDREEVLSWIESR